MTLDALDAVTITLLVGGVRSGKSTLAVEIGRRHDGEVVFVATAEPFDDDMRDANRAVTAPSARRGRRSRSRSTSRPRRLGRPASR